MTVKIEKTTIKKKVKKAVKKPVKKLVKKSVKKSVEKPVKKSIKKNTRLEGVAVEPKKQVKKKASSSRDAAKSITRGSVPNDNRLKPVVRGAELEQYIEAVGRRKTAIARVRLFTKGKGKKEFLINEKEYQNYFPNFELQETINAPLEVTNNEDEFKVSVKVKGGGVYSQAEAVRHGISRALIKFNPELRKRLKKVGFLTRDSRMRERKKFGLKRARRGPQWSKR